MLFSFLLSPLKYYILKRGLFLIALFIYLFIGLFFTLLSPQIALTANQEPSCQPIFGGGKNCQQSDSIKINKTIQNPQNLKFVDNLGPESNIKFTPGQIVTFQINVTNTSSAPVKNITIKDKLPPYISCALEEAKQCDKTTKIITARISNLNANETKTITLKGKIDAEDKFPKDQDTVCIINQATATQNLVDSQDNSQFCAQKNTKPLLSSQNKNSTPKPVYPAPRIKTTPQTGPETLSLIMLIASGLIGLSLHQKTK